MWKLKKQNKLKTLQMSFIISIVFTAFGIFGDNISSSVEIIMSIVGITVAVFILGYFVEIFNLKPHNTEVFSNIDNVSQPQGGMFRAWDIFLGILMYSFLFFISLSLAIFVYDFGFMSELSYATDWLPTDATFSLIVLWLSNSLLLFLVVSLFRNKNRLIVAKSLCWSFSTILFISLPFMISRDAPSELGGALSGIFILPFFLFLYPLWWYFTKKIFEKLRIY